MEAIIPILAIIAVLAIISLCMVGSTGERNSFRSWIGIFIGSMLLFSMFMLLANKWGMVKDYPEFSLLVRSFFAILFGLLTLKYLAGMSVINGPGNLQYSLLIRTYLSAIAFLSLIGVMSWGIAIGSALVLLGYPLIHLFERQNHSRLMKSKTQKDERIED